MLKKEICSSYLTLLNRFAPLIAEAVLFLDSEGAKYISGHELVVDGGVSTSVMAHLPRE